MSDPLAGRLVLWRAGDSWYGTPVERAREVLPLPPVTPIPDVAPPVLGVANVRGDVVTVLDARTLLGVPSAPPPEYLVLVDCGGRLVGLAVDAVGDLTRPDLPGEAPPDPVPGTGGSSRVPGAVRVPDLDRLVGPLFPDARSAGSPR